MKKILVVVVLSFCLLSVGMIPQKSNAEALKVGIVDLLRALNESEAGKRAKADLESLIKSKQTSIEEKGKNIEKLKAELEKQAAIISAEAKKAKEEELERLIRDYQRVVADSQAEVKKKEGELTGEILKDLREMINKIVQEEGYNLILENAEGLVLYANKSLDLTDKVIKRYNESKAGKK
ncbi:outer membrane protein [Dissulfurispira thermophila]|uniref:Outer membrane protein n=1 Tax=Dissulfurispira thermophila TaxID=2715679 RepID=A0A7G1H0C7_9BACT|nr:OmpH family outer membrane protein [Dissulfurispira thermophila]BCB95147.1 outer membrane protein [Dissulfurispira thermophila]